MYFKLSSAKWRPFCLGLNVLIMPLPDSQYQFLLRTLPLYCLWWRKWIRYLLQNTGYCCAWMGNNHMMKYQCSTVQCHYNAVIFLTNPHYRHPLDCTWVRYGVPFVSFINSNLFSILVTALLYAISYGRVIMAPDFEYNKMIWLITFLWK